MRSSRGQAGRRGLDARGLKRMELWERERRSFRLAADLVAREQAVMAVIGGVLERLRHQGPGELLQLEREVAHPRRRVAGGGGEIERHRIAKEIEDIGVGGGPAGPGASNRVLDA